MVRQRAPYWMYSLRSCAVTSPPSVRRLRLEREGLGFARNVQYAILFDRLLRFPITGSRVRNYDGLGGQLRCSPTCTRVGIWPGPTTSSRSTGIGWPMGVIALRADEIFALYKRRGDRPHKLQHWRRRTTWCARSLPPASGPSGSPRCELR